MTETAIAPGKSDTLITCDTGGCPGIYWGAYSFVKTWTGAVDAGWRSDATGQRRCPSCVTARLPVPGFYVAPHDLGAWVASLEAAPPPLEKRPVLAAEPAGAAPLPEAEPPLEPVPPLGELDEDREAAMARFNQIHDSQAAEPDGLDGDDQAAAEPAAGTVGDL